MIDTQALVLTNAGTIKELTEMALGKEAIIDAAMQTFSIEAYYDNLDDAKKDRAIFNSIASDINSFRLAREREYMEAFDPFKEVMNRLGAKVKAGSNQLGEIVKAVEETEKNEKKVEIESTWNVFGFTLITLDRIFDQKWLNKGSKLKDIKIEMERRIAKTYEDIAIIENFGQDQDTLKAIYLDTLDIGQALAKGQQLKANREKLERDEAERPARDKAEKEARERAELAMEAARALEADKASTFASEADGEEKDPLVTITLEFTGTRASLVALKTYMLDQGITYRKL